MPNSRPGRGQTRFFDPRAIYSAIVLNALADAGVRGRQYREVTRQIATDRLWMRATEGEQGIVLHIAMTPSGITAWTAKVPNRGEQASRGTALFTLDLAALFRGVPVLAAA